MGRQIFIAALAAAAGLTLAGCGAGSQPVHGQVLGGTQAGATVAEATGGVSGICAGATTGSQVVIKGPDGKLLATTTLRPSGQQAIGGVGSYTFDTTIPAGPGPYTVDMPGVSSLVVNASDLKHLHLTCSGG